ncbi:DedA family protein [Saccharopolyspora sp. NPDC000995]
MTDLLGGIPGPLALAVAVALLFAESGLVLGVFLPGSATVLALGWLAGHGVVEVWVAAISAFGATASGCQHGYFRGRRDGLLRRQLVKRFGEKRFARAESALDGRAKSTVAASQCFAVVRTLMPRLAGRNSMTHLRFTICNVAPRSGVGDDVGAARCLVGRGVREGGSGSGIAGAAAAGHRSAARAGGVVAPPPQAAPPNPVSTFRRCRGVFAS